MYSGNKSVRIGLKTNSIPKVIPKLNSWIGIQLGRQAKGQKGNKDIRNSINRFRPKE